MNSKLKILIIGLLIISLTIPLFFYNNLTGKAIVNTEDVKLDNGSLKGNLKLSLYSGELLPYNTKIIFKTSEQKKEYLLDELIDETENTGNYYISGVNLTNSGKGYGILGTKKIYPEISFKLRTYTTQISQNTTKQISETENTEETTSETTQSKEDTEKTNNSISNSNISENSSKTTENNSEIIQDNSTTSINNEQITQTNDSISETSSSEQNIENITTEQQSSETSESNNQEQTTEISTENTEETTQSKEDTEKTNTDSLTTIDSEQISETENTEQQSSETSESNNQEQTTETSTENTEETTSEQTTDSTSEQQSTENTEETSEQTTITGNMIRSLGNLFNLFTGLNPSGNMITEIDQEISGKVSKNKQFVYELNNNEQIELISGSIEYNGKKLNNSVIDISISGNQAIITTNYYIEEKGFGADYINDEIKEININLSKLNDKISGKKLDIIIQAQNQNITTSKKQIKPKTNLSLEKEISENSLTSNELKTLSNKFGKDFSLKTTKAEIINNRLIVKHELDKYWVEYSYDYTNEISDYILDKVEKDKIIWLKTIANSLNSENINKTKIPELIKTQKFTTNSTNSSI